MFNWRLGVGDDLGGDRHRIDAAPRLRAVRLLAVHDDAESVRCRHQWPAPIANGTGAQRPGVEREDGLRLEIPEELLLEHQRGAALFTLGRPFLGRLEDEDDGAWQLRLQASQHPRRAEERGGVHVVAARVHDADFLAVVGRALLRSERQVDLLGHRQRVHVGAQRHDAALLGAAQDAHDTGVRNPGPDLESEAL
jgi:hypothetical protein